MAIVFSLWNGDTGRTDICVSMLVVLVLCVMLIEKEFCIDCIGMCEQLVVVGVWCDV